MIYQKNEDETRSNMVVFILWCGRRSGGGGRIMCSAARVYKREMRGKKREMKMKW